MPRVAAAVQDLLSQNSRVRIWITFLGKLQELRVKAVNDKNIVVDVQGNDFPIGWSTISDHELLGVAKSICGDDGGRILLAAEAAIALGANDDAMTLLLRAGEADPNLGERIAAVAALIPQGAAFNPAAAKPINALQAAGLGSASSHSAGHSASASTGKTAAQSSGSESESESESETAMSKLPLSGGAPSRAYSPTKTAGPNDYLGKVGSLKPGDVLLLQPGTYTKNLRLDKLNGSKNLPIVITGPESGPRPVFIATKTENTVELRDCSFVVVRNLELDGKGLDGPMGVSAKSGKVHDITIDGLYIHDYNGTQQIDGISTKVPTWNWIVRNNVLERIGTGMYFGNSDGRWPFVNGLIEYNLIVDTTGYNIQIKHQESRPEIPGISKGVTIIRHNVFVKSKWYVKNDGARPNLLVGHPPMNGTGSDDQFLIYGNFFWKNAKGSLFQGEGNIAFFNNICVNPDNDGIRLANHNGKIMNAAVFNNTIVAKGRGIFLQSNKGYTQFIVGNAVFSDGIRGDHVENNITGSYADAAKYLMNPFGGPGTLSCFPRPGMLRREPLDLNRFKDYLEALKDFNGNPRTGSWRGAYAGEGANPGWKFALAKKD